MQKPAFIPRPLVRVNQWIILLSTIATWIFQQPLILLIPLVANLLGLLFNFNPFMKFARLFLKKKPSEYIPEDVVQQNSIHALLSHVYCLALLGLSLINL